MNSTEPEEPRTVVDDANDAYDAVRAICHSLPYNAPAPLVYSVLGNLKHAGGHDLSEAITKMVAGLSRSLIDFDNYMDDRSDPAAAVQKAKHHLLNAVNLASKVGAELESAQSAINGQGYRTPGDPGYRAPEDRK
jgi:hypothetical protein